MSSTSNTNNQNILYYYILSRSSCKGIFDDFAVTVRSVPFFPSVSGRHLRPMSSRKNAVTSEK